MFHCPRTGLWGCDIIISVVGLDELHCLDHRIKDNGHFLFYLFYSDTDIPVCYLWRAAIVSDELNQPRISVEEEGRKRHTGRCSQQ